MHNIDRTLISKLRGLANVRVAPDFEKELPLLSQQAKEQLFRVLQDIEDKGRMNERRAAQQPWRHPR